MEWNGLRTADGEEFLTSYDEVCDTFGSMGLQELPEKYEMLVVFFDNLDYFIRFLRSKDSKPTFMNVCPIIGRVTDRRFTYKHLSQLKFILPEALEFQKVHTINKRSGLVTPDLPIRLNADAIEKDGKSNSATGSMIMHNVLRSRLLDFVNEHPEGEDVPEGPLPKPFNESMRDMNSDMVLQTKLDRIEKLHMKKVYNDPYH